MRERALPCCPRNTRGLEPGDLIAVPHPAGWCCLQVTDVKRGGPGSLTCFVAGALPWLGSRPPTRESVTGLAAVEQGLTRIELFTKGGLQVTGNAPVTGSGLAFNFREPAVGTVHLVWGWQAAIERARAAADRAGAHGPVN